MIARRAGQLLTAVVLATSATYLLVYLYRWEWNRALVSGLFFVAAEIAVVASSLLRRLQRIEGMLERGSAQTRPPDPVALDSVRASAPSPRNHFAWLEESARSSNVFVPVLLGAGVVLSLLAHVVERLALVTGTPLLERRLAARLDPIALPTAGLLGPHRVTSGNPGPVTPPAQRLANRAFTVCVALLGILASTQLVDLVADATQSRLEPAPTGQSMELTLKVATKGGGDDLDETAEALWVTCRNILNRQVDGGEIVPLGLGTYRLLITPSIGDHARRRLEGCIEDSTLDRTVGQVVSFVEVPSPRP